MSAPSIVFQCKKKRQLALLYLIIGAITIGFAPVLVRLIQVGPNRILAGGDRLSNFNATFNATRIHFAK